MGIPERTLLGLAPGHRSAETASFLAQLDELSRRMWSDLKGVGPSELEWQPAPGMNTIGMLLAHIAIVEVFWMENGIRGVPRAEADIAGRIGIGMDGDGMPAPPRGGHPAGLRGKRLPYYRRLLRLARSHVRRVSKGLGTRDLTRVRRRTRGDGKRHDYNARWVLYHLVEHLAGHYGQILMLRHAYRALRRR